MDSGTHFVDDLQATTFQPIQDIHRLYPPFTLMSSEPTCWRRPRESSSWQWRNLWRHPWSPRRASRTLIRTLPPLDCLVQGQVQTGAGQHRREGHQQVLHRHRADLSRRHGGERGGDALRNAAQPSSARSSAKFGARRRSSARKSTSGVSVHKSQVLEVKFTNHVQQHSRLPRCAPSRETIQWLEVLLSRRTD